MLRRSPVPSAVVVLVAMFSVFAIGCSGSSKPSATGTPPPSPVPLDTRSAVAGATTASCGSSEPARPGLALTDRGAIQGSTAGSTWAWKGIPFAAPPLGALRWQPPADPACLKTTLDAKEFANVCPQFEGDAIVGNEDCLYLNVWAPTAAATKGPLPVMFFVHGGGNVQGSTGEKTRQGEPIYDGQYLAANGDVVVVTVAYRLGVFGFLAHPGLDTESPNHASGNYGLMDQIAALKWVQRNIGQFGGDPSRVMVFGESAGAVDTCMLVASPLAKGLFSRALMESGACIAGPKATREGEGSQVAIKAGCADEKGAPGCLRALSAERVMRAVPATVSVASPGLNNYGPVIDGYVLTGQPWEVIAAGGHNHVPFIIGSNSDETSMAVGAVPTCQQFAAGVRSAYPAIAAQILELYPCTAYATPRKAATAVSTDARFICTALLSSRSAAKGQSEGVYRYQYSHAINSPLLKELGAWHGGEIPFVFQHVNISGYRADAGDTATANAVLKYWTRFAATGDPNGEGTPRWDRYDAAKDNYINIDSTTSAAAGLRTEQCAFWSKVAGLEAP